MKKIIALITGTINKDVTATPPGMINSVLGPISPDKLGTTLVHEHFAFAYPGWYADETIAPYDYKAVLKANLAVIEAAQKYGIKTIIDATTNDVGGRNPMLYKELARKTGMNIICSTGLYTEQEGAPAYFKTRQVWYGTDISKMMSELFIKEITEGIGKTGVKAGVIKCGTSGGGPISPYETAVLKAAVIAQKATGVPIITHTDGPLGGVEQAELFLAEGANPKKVMIGHVSNSRDIEYHKAILEKGVYIAFDRIGLEILTPTDINVKNIAELCKLGFANQITLSHDTVNVWLGRQFVAPESVLQALANWRIDFISEKVIPALKAQGVTDEQIKTMMVDNPKNLFLCQ
jgi:phosphotriesterase-related protein